MFARLIILFCILLLHVAFAEKYCGRSFPDARKCQTSCPRGLDVQCPSSERCFDGVGCLSSSSTPVSVQVTSSAAAIVSTTNSEYDKYGNLHQCSSRMAARIAEYGTALGLHLDGCDRDTPWSAAFVSFMVREAGGGSEFLYSNAHRDYIHDAFAGGRGLYHYVWDIDIVSVSTGDLVCSGRGRVASWNFDDFLDWYRKGGTAYDAIPTLCDIVVQVSCNMTTVVGGDVNERLTRKTVNKSTYAIRLPLELVWIWRQ